jgi:hypothetical protein
MDYCRICTQHYISHYICRHGQIYIPYIAISSEINPHNLSHYLISDDWLVKPLLQCYESPQKSSWFIVTFLKENESMGQVIWSQHDQKWTLMDGL